MRRTFQCQSCGGSYPDVQPDGKLYFHVCGPLAPDKNGVQAERPDKRDENMALNRLGALIGIKAEGSGVRCLTDPKVLQPAWIAPFMKSIGREEENADVDAVA